MVKQFASRAQQNEYIFSRFSAGERPVSLIKSNVAAPQVVYKCYKKWVALRVVNRLMVMVASNNMGGIDHRKLQKLLDELEKANLVLEREEKKTIITA